MSIYSVNWHVFFSILTFFATLTGNDAPNRLNIIIFVISRSISVEIDTSLALFQKFCFWRPFWIFFENAVRHIGGSYQPILLILNSKQWKTTFYLPCNFEENRTKIATVRVPQRKTYKMAAMTSSISNFQNPRKTDLANICQIICRKFHQNPSIRQSAKTE